MSKLSDAKRSHVEYNLSDHDEAERLIVEQVLLITYGCIQLADCEVILTWYMRGRVPSEIANNRSSRFRNDSRKIKHLFYKQRPHNDHFDTAINIRTTLSYACPVNLILDAIVQRTIVLRLILS
jgi:hypothetical protein